MTGLIDAAGTVHEPAPADARIVSLVPSITELLFDLGLGDRVVGRTAFCVHPADRVKAVTSVGGTKTVRMDKIAALHPTHAIVNVDETPRDLADEMAAAGIRVVITHPVEVRDNLALYRLLGGMFGAEAEAEALCARFTAAYDATVAAAEGLPERRVLYLIWTGPWMTVSRDTYVSRMLSLVRWGTGCWIGRARYPSLELTPAIVESMDRVLFSTEPFPFKDRHIAEFRQAFPDHADKALFIDGQMVSWYGSRAIAGLGYLTDLAAGLP